MDDRKIDYGNFPIFLAQSRFEGSPKEIRYGRDDSERTAEQFSIQYR